MNHQSTVRTGVSLSALARIVFATPDGSGMNACVACCDRWVDSGRTGLEWFDRDGNSAVSSFAMLRDNAARFANLLTARGVRPGDVVAGMLPRGAEMITVILGTWRAGAVYQPISTSLSLEAIDAHINHTGRQAAKLIVTDNANRGRLDDVDFCPLVLVVANGARVRCGDGDFAAEMSRQSASFAPVARDGDDPFLLLVGGRGGRRAPVMPTLRSLLTVLSSVQVGLNPEETDIGWDVTDPAWSCGLYFSVLRPLLQGQAAVARESDRTVFNFELPLLRARTFEPLRTVRAFPRAAELELAA